MADWDGLRHGLEESVVAPPLDTLRQRHKHRQQRRTIAMACAVVMVGGASGFAVLDRATQRDNGPATIAILDRVVANETLLPPKDYRDYVVTDADFVTPTTGWALGLRCAGETCDVATFRSVDGGASWERPVDVARAVPRTSFHTEDPAGGAARSIRMVTETTGYAFNPDLYVTRDGARTWSRVPQPSKVQSISVADGSVWVTERGCPAGVDCDVVVLDGVAGGPLSAVDVPSTGGPATVRRSSLRDGYLLTTSPASFRRTSDGGVTWRDGEMPCPDATATALSAGPGRPLWLVCSAPGGRRAFRSADHGATWTALGAPPADGVVTDLVARSATVAYLATQTPGRLYVTRDGGATWQDTGAGKAYGYANVDPVDDTHAFAMGDAGHLWRTTDGTRWERLALPPGASRSTATPAPTTPPAPQGLRGTTVNRTEWRDLYFLDAERGWALGQQCGPKVCHVIIRRTVDGGATWSRVPGTVPTYRSPEVGEVHPPNRVSRIAFADDRNGWLFGEYVFATHDGGRTWREVRAGYTYDVVPAGEVVWSVDYEGCASQPCGGSVSRAPVSSDTWAPVEGSGYRGEDIRQATFAAPDAAHAYVMDMFPSNGVESVVSATTDGGRTWTTHDAPCPDSHRTLSPYGPRGLWVLCVGMTDGDTHSVAVSADGGAMWRTTPLPERADGRTEIVALSATDAWLGGATRGLEVTRDGGATWQAAPEIKGQVHVLTFADERHGWLLSDNVLWRTTDGQTWTRLG